MREWSLLLILISFLGLALALLIYPLRAHKKMIWIASPIVLVAVFLAYGHWGAYSSWHDYLSEETSRQKIKALMSSIHSPEELIKKLKKQLNNKPESAKGWYLLGRLYASQGVWEKARESFAKAKSLKPEDEQIIINYAQSLWQLNHQAFNQEIRQLFNQVLQENSRQPDALAMLAMDAYMSHDYHLAIEYWQNLLQIAEPGSEDALAIRKAIAKAEEGLAKQ